MEICKEGITIVFDEECLKDYEVWELLFRVKSGEPETAPMLLRRMLGSEQMDRVKAEYRACHDGKLPAYDFVKFVLGAIEDASAQLKNS